jgi:hypothetical protein
MKMLSLFPHDGRVGFRVVFVFNGVPVCAIWTLHCVDECEQVSSLLSRGVGCPEMLLLVWCGH